MKHSWTLEEDLGFQMASLRLFLRIYSKIRPEVLSALLSAVRPHYLPLPIAGGEEEREEEAAVFRTALDQWIKQFDLPPTDEMKAEAIWTLHFVRQEAGRLFFYWDYVEETMEALKREGAHDESYYYPFIFQAQGWRPGTESIKEARDRLQKEFENAIKEHAEVWDQSQRIGASIHALCQQHKDHVRNIRWLAQKQAGLLSMTSIARGDKVSIDTVRRGLQSAAKCLGGAIRYAPPGRKSRARST